MPRSADLQDSRGAVGPWSTAPLSAFALVVVNLLPLWAVLTDRMSMGDVFLVYWVENVAVWLITIVKVASARGVPGPDGRGSMRINGKPVDESNQGFAAGFFALHYGIFTVVHGAFAVAMAVISQGELHPALWLVAGAGMAASHLASLWLNWYGEGERWQVTAGQAMLQPYPRMIVLHVAIIGGFFLVLRGVEPGVFGGEAVTHAGPVLILCGLKTVVDLAFHLRERGRARGASEDVVARHTGPEE